MSTVQQLTVHASKDRRAVGVFTLQPIGGTALTEAVVEVASHFPGATADPADFAIDVHRFDDEGSQYSFGTCAFVRFDAPQSAEVLTAVIREVGEAVSARGYELIPVHHVR